ncbi:MAG: hypothetical protein WC455_21020 [Dehalococcoidia bacterium]|jgi:hypothetical protein
MKPSPTLTGKYFYCTANGSRAHITIVTYPTYLDKKSATTLCNTKGEFIHLGNRLVNDYQARALGVSIAEVCPECLAAYGQQPALPQPQFKPVPAKGQRRTRKKPIEC